MAKKKKKKVSRKVKHKVVKKAVRKTSSKIQLVKVKSNVSKGTAVAALILNIILPGVGTLIAGKTNIGVLQLVLFLVGLFMTLTILGAILGVPLMLVMWVWAVVTGVKLISETA